VLDTTANITNPVTQDSDLEAVHVSVDAILAIRDGCALKDSGGEGLAENQESSSDDCSEFGSTLCVCPKCGKRVPHATRGVPCNRTLCPYCGSRMRGTQCWE